MCYKVNQLAEDLEMLGFTKSLGWKKSSAIVATLAIAALAVPHTTAAQEWLAAQQKRPSAIAPTEQPNAFSAPSQLGTTPPGVLPRTPATGSSSNSSATSSTQRNRSRSTEQPRSTEKQRRVPIPDVPMPGEYRPNLDSGPEKTRRLSDIPGSTQLINGISGQVTLIPICSYSTPATACQPRPYQGPIKLTSTSDGRVSRLTPSADGTFQVKLSPGLYRIESDDPTSPLGSGQTVAVVQGVMRQVELQVQAQLPQSSSQSRTQSSPSNLQPITPSDSQSNAPTTQSNPGSTPFN